MTSRLPNAALRYYSPKTIMKMKSNTCFLCGAELPTPDLYPQHLFNIVIEDEKCFDRESDERICWDCAEATAVPDNE